MKRLLILLSLCLPLLLLIGCGATAQPNTINLYSTSFDRSSVTINKGDSLTLVNAGSYTHVINNGSWIGGQAVPGVEAGAPVVNLIMVDVNQQVTIGPFNTAGTYHIYCPIHAGMNMTIIVQGGY